jgi:hypothetical protein
MTTVSKQVAMKCANCRWFKVEDREYTGECRKYAPRRLQWSDGYESGSKTWWPAVKKNDFCGEFDLSDEARLEAM